MQSKTLVAILLIFSTTITGWNVFGLAILHNKLIIPNGLPNNNCSVLITGSAGFIGMHTALGIKKNGARVIGVDTFTTYYSTKIKKERAAVLEKNNIETFNISICDKFAISEMLTKYKISHVVHLAAQPGIGLSLKKPEDYIHTNVECFSSLLEAMRIASVKNLIYASSSSVYGSAPPPFRESQQPSPTNTYGASKLHSEILASVFHKLYDINVVGLRFFTVYGPWMRPDMAVYKFASKMYLKETIYIKGRGLQRDFTYIDDVVLAVRSVFWYFQRHKHKVVNEVFNIGRSDPHAIDQLPLLLGTYLGITSPKVTYTSPVSYNIPHTSADISKAENELGFRATVEFNEGVKSFMKWFDDNKEWCATAALETDSD